MKNVKDIYALSPMQEMMLMHSLAHAKDDVLFNQVCYEIKGEIDDVAFETAWQRLVDRHDILRTAFLWEDLKNPIQVVREQAILQFERFDWSSASAANRRKQLQKYRDADKERGFDPRKAPLMRVVLIRFDEHTHFLVWSSHHLLLDRWCFQLVFEDLFGIYKSLCNGRSPQQHDPVQFRKYIDWIRQQDESLAMQFWNDALAGYSSAKRLTDPVEGATSDFVYSEFDGDEITALRDMAKQFGVTVSILLQGAWSLTLNRLFGFQDTVFGAAVAGRPPEILGVESIIGSFVNNVPVRVRMPRGVSLRNWLHEMQRTQHKRANFEYVSPAVIQQCSELPLGESIFDTLIVTLGSTGQTEDPALNLRPLAGHIRTAYPLTDSIGETDTQISIRVELQAGRRCKISLRKLLSEYETTLRYLATSAGEDTIGSLPEFSGELESADLETASAKTTFVSSNQSASIDNQEGREEADIDIMEDALRSEWQLALGITDIEPDDDFFKLGGSSLQAATMHARIESVTRKSIPLLMLFSATTLRGMSETLARGSWPLRSELAIGLRTDGSKPPLFCVASPEVNTVGYALLAQYQAEDRPVYILQAPPDEKIMRRLSPVDIPAIATVYLRELQRIQPNGPYYLLGMCTGSQILLEIARQLRNEGERTAFAGIINTWAHYTVSRAYAVQRLMNTGRWYTNRLHELWRLSAAEQLAELLRVARVRLSSLTLRADDKDKGLDQTAKHGAELMQKDIDHRGERIALETRQFSDPWIEDFGWANKDPKAEKYAGTLTVFRIQRQQFWRTGEEDLGWGKHADTVRVENLPAPNHNDVLRQPHVQVIAKRVADLIREVEKKDDP